MYLHEDKSVFKDIIEQVSTDTGRASAVIEKDRGLSNHNLLLCK